MASGFSDEKKASKNINLLTQILGTELKSTARFIDDAVKYALSSPSPDDALNNLERIASSCGKDAVKIFFQEDASVLQPLTYIAGASNFLSNILIKNPLYLEWLFLENNLYIKKDETAFCAELEDVWLRTALKSDSFETAAKALRQYREREYLRIGARDILTIAGMKDTAEELSALAGACLETAYKFCLKKLKDEHGTPVWTAPDGSEKEVGFAIIGMGKLGGMELNFSSDIDIIYIYSSDRGEVIKTAAKGRADTHPQGWAGAGISLHAFFVKLSELITKLIGQVTEDGIVFRVDLNLRPEGKNGDIANSMRSAEIYYESWGQTWERAAMLKARTAAGSQKLGREFLMMLEPFIYRRYLDFSAIEEIKGMKEKIDLSLLRRNTDSVDVKLGYGGIREIEFFVQALQLINAGKDKSIRTKNTIDTLKMLSGKGCITKEDALTLTEAYIFLRDVEHKIQIVEARQTHAIPVKDRGITKLAKTLGFNDDIGTTAVELFWKRYKEITADVHEIYEKLFYKPSEDIEKDIPREILLALSDDIEKDEAVALLGTIGFKLPEKAFENIVLIKYGPPFAHYPQKTQTVLTRILPFLISKIVLSPDPDIAVSCLERFISRVGARTVFYSLLAENKSVMELLVKLFSTSAFLSRTFIEHPEIMDCLLSREVSKPYKNRDELKNELSASLELCEDYEAKLDGIRRFKNTEILRIGINDIFGELNVRDVSRQITFLADASLEKALGIAMDDMSGRYGMPSDKRFAVIALGKLGGEEITYSSDLDLIFVYSGAGETSGAKKITNHEFFTKLCQRIITILSIITKEGFAFKVDARLRPSGSSGPLVTTMDAFLKYHETKAAIWERQAMLKARFSTGDSAFGMEVIESLQNIIYKKGISEDEIKELLRIRTRMELEIAKETVEKHNIKTGKGGLVDIEFGVQVMQLRYGKDYPSVKTQNTLDGFAQLAAERLISQKDYAELKEAYNFYRLMENRLRIVNDRTDDVIIKGSADTSKLAKRMGFEGDNAGNIMIESYLVHSQKIREIYTNLLKGIST